MYYINFIPWKQEDYINCESLDKTMITTYPPNNKKNKNKKMDTFVNGKN